MADLMMPKTGSTVSFRGLYNALPASVAVRWIICSRAVASGPGGGGPSCFCVFAGIGHDFGAINGDGAHFEELEFAGGEESFEEGFLDESVVFAAEGADGIVVRMGVGADEADGDFLLGGVFDPAGAEPERGGDSWTGFL